MKPTVWYNAVKDHIIVRVSRNRIELGCQGSTSFDLHGQKYTVPDWLNLFTWKLDLKVWKKMRKQKLLIKLGKL